MINTRRITETVRTWHDEYTAYKTAMDKYVSTPKLLRKLKGMKEPRHPRFHSMQVLWDAENGLLLELRCNNGVFLAVGTDERKGYKLDLTGNGNKESMLGSRGMDINDEQEQIVKNILPELMIIVKDNW